MKGIFSLLHTTTLNEIGSREGLYFITAFDNFKSNKDAFLLSTSEMKYHSFLAEIVNSKHNTKPSQSYSAVSEHREQSLLFSVPRLW